ncbi:MAG: amidohydrolase, partial [Deltaproteobacteria bacterium]
MSLYLKNAKYLDWQTFEISVGHLLVEEGVDGSVTSVPQIPAQSELKTDDRVIDCHDRLVTKSFGCGHHHIYSTLARGMPAPKKIPTNFQEILTYVWWTVDKCLDLEMVEASALASAL